MKKNFYLLLAFFSINAKAMELPGQPDWEDSLFDLLEKAEKEGALCTFESLLTETPYIGPTDAHKYAYESSTDKPQTLPLLTVPAQETVPTERTETTCGILDLKKDDGSIDILSSFGQSAGHKIPKKSQLSCPVCNKSCLCSEMLKDHILYLHNDEHPYACTKSDCLFKAKSSSQFQTHMRKAHQSREKPTLASYKYAAAILAPFLSHWEHQCARCNALFETKNGLSRHGRSCKE